jgi:hypothetical protein
MPNTAPHAPLIAVTLLLAGCVSTSDPNDDSLNFDAAVIAADGALEDLEMMHGPRLGLRGGIFPGLIGNKPDCPMTQDMFLCDPIEREGIEYTRTITYMNSAGDPQGSYDEASTASIHYEISVVGRRARERWSADINRQRSLTVTGLLDGVGEVTWNGTGTGTVLRSRHIDGGDVRTYNVASSDQVNEVVVPYPREDDSWPITGSITKSMTMTRTSDEGDETRTRTASLAFNGTSVVEVTVEGETFTVDLTEKRFGPGKMGRGRGGGMH